MRRAIPVLLLALAAAAAAARAWPRVVEVRRFGTLLDLVQKHSGVDGDGWPPADRERLWATIDGFLDRDPERLSRRLMDAVEDDESRIREAALVLAADLSFLQSYGKYLSMRYPTCNLPHPTRQVRAELDRFHIDAWAVRRADRWTARVDEPSLRARRSLWFLAAPKTSRPFRAILESMAVREPDVDLRMDVLHKLAGGTAPASTLGLLQRLMSDPLPRIRWAATTGLARQSDPEGTRRFVAGLNLRPSGVPSDDLMFSCAFLRRFGSLEDWVSGTIEHIRDLGDAFAGLPCDLRQPWEAWLALRETEGFAPGPQAARDEAYREER